jgi:hypothetical protein
MRRVDVVMDVPNAVDEQNTRTNSLSGDSGDMKAAAGGKGFVEPWHGAPSPLVVVADVLAGKDGIGGSVWLLADEVVAIFDDFVCGEEFSEYEATP